MSRKQLNPATAYRIKPYRIYRIVSYRVVIVLYRKGLCQQQNMVKEVTDEPSRWAFLTTSSHTQRPMGYFRSVKKKGKYLKSRACTPEYVLSLMPLTLKNSSRMYVCMSVM